MGQDPSEIREQIEETRSRMGDTVDALSYKADVKGRAGDYVTDKRDAVVGKADELVSRVRGAAPDTEQAKQAGRKAVGVAQENPLGLAIGGAAVGFLLGMTLPSTRVEDERIGTVADDLKERVRETSQEAYERGKTVAQEAASTAVETAKERGREEGEQLKSSAQESAEQVRSSAEQAAPGSSQ